MESARALLQVGVEAVRLKAWEQASMLGPNDERPVAHEAFGAIFKDLDQPPSPRFKLRLSIGLPGKIALFIWVFA